MALIDDQVSVTRADSAAKSDEWWYQVTNQDYLEIFTPSGRGSGNGERRHCPLPSRRRRTINHGEFQHRPGALKAMESTLAPVQGILAGLAVPRSPARMSFATWLTTPAGTTSTANFDYQRNARTNPSRTARRIPSCSNASPRRVDQALDAVAEAPRPALYGR